MLNDKVINVFSKINNLDPDVVKFKIKRLLYKGIPTNITKDGDSIIVSMISRSKVSYINKYGRKIWVPVLSKFNVVLQ